MGIINNCAIANSALAKGVEQQPISGEQQQLHGHDQLVSQLLNMLSAVSTVAPKHICLMT